MEFFGKLDQSLENKDALLKALRAVDISVPPPGKARTKAHMERWTAYRLLSSLAAAGHLSFPLSVRKGERPDFTIAMGSEHIGLEVTQSTNSEYRKFCAFAAKERDNYFIDPSLFTIGMPPMDRAGMIEMLDQKKLTGPGWRGDQPERLWASYVLYAVEAKIERLRSPGFGTFEQNWLAVYGNAPVGWVDPELATGILSTRMEHIWRATPCFDQIFIEENDRVILMSPVESKIIVLHNVWRGTA